MKTKKQAKAQPAPIPAHRQAKSEAWGYEFKDGKYYLPPCVATAMDELAYERASVDALLSAVNAYVTERYQQIIAREQRWWKDVGEQVGFDFQEGRVAWVYHAGRIERMPEPTRTEGDSQFK